MKKAPHGSAVFETVSEARFTGRVTEKAGGKGVTATSGIVAYIDAEGLPAALTFGVRDLKVSAKPFARSESHSSATFLSARP